MKVFVLSSFLRTLEGQSFLELAGQTEEGKRFIYYRKNKDVEPYYWTLKTENFDGVNEASNLNGKKVSKISFTTVEALREAKRQAFKGSTFESDIDFNTQFLQAHDIGSCLEISGEPKEIQGDTLIYYNNAFRKTSFFPELKMFSFDLETNVKSIDFTSPENDLYSISIYSEDHQCVLMVDEALSQSTKERLGEFDFYCFPSEKEVLEQFIQIIHQDRANVFIGWNVVNFDFQFLFRKAMKYGIPLSIGHEGKNVEHYYSKSNDFSLEIVGKAVIDGMQLMKAQGIELENYKLDTAAGVLLGQNKTIQSTNDEKVKEIERLFLNNKRELAEYNYIDSKLVYDLFKKVNGCEFFTHYHLLAETQFGLHTSFIEFCESIYLKKLHAKNFVAPDKNFSPAFQSKVSYHVTGQNGFHGRVLKMRVSEIDAKIIAYFSLDVFANVMGNIHHEESITYGKGLHFHPPSALSSEILRNLLAKVDEDEKEDVFQKALRAVISHFTSGLLNRYTRFYSPLVYHLVGQMKKEILTETVKIIEKEFSLVSVYNNEDEIYVRVEELKKDPDAAFYKKINEKLQHHFKEKYGVDALIDWVYVETYDRIFVNDERFALFKNGKIINHLDSHRFNVPFLKFFQDEILKAAFLGANLPVLIEEIKEELKEGKFNSLLVYKRKINPSKKEESHLPHVVAAKKGNQNLSMVEYVITKVGVADPISHLVNPIDYDYYIKKYIEPSSRMILKYTAFSEIPPAKDEGQIDLFSL